MTKKDYIKLADLFNRKRPVQNDFFDYSSQCSIYSQLLTGLITLLQSDNPNFDAAKFREACNK